MLQVFLTREYLAISMEFAQGGDLFAYTLGPKSYGKLAEAQARWIFQQLILGLDYCHRKVCLCCEKGTDYPAQSVLHYAIITLLNVCGIVIGIIVIVVSCYPRDCYV